MSEFQNLTNPSKNVKKNQNNIPIFFNNKMT